MSQSAAFPFIVRLNRVDCITLSSVITTALAVALALEHHLFLAMSLLFVAMTSDAVDGMLARRWGLTRNFGRYLDGFMDVLIYLVSPAIVAYQSGFSGWWGVLLMLYIGCGCVRLAVFNEIGNVEDKGRLHYLGMPVFWSLFIIAGHQLLLHWLPPLLCHSVLAVALLLFSLLMVTRQPFFKFTSMTQILLLTLGGALVFLVLELQLQGIDPLQLPWQALFWLQLPLVVGGVLHMVVVTRDSWAGLKIPLHRRWFGANKTLRGFVAMPLFAALAALAPGLAGVPVPAISGGLGPVADWLMLGAWAGLAYVAAELPNSFFKRRLGAAPGLLPHRGRGLFVALDQLDSATGVALAYWLLGLPWQVCLLFLVTFPLTALVVKRLLFRLGLKRTAT